MKNDRVFILRESVVKITQMLSGKGIRVTQQGVNAYVKADHTGQPVQVNLPYLPDNATEELCNAIQGFLDHEVAHILFTEFPVMNEAMKHGEQIGFMLNALEDPRIEKEMSKRFQGSAYNLGVTGKFYLDKFVVPKLKEKAAAGDVNGVIRVLMVPMIRAMSGQQVFREFMKDHWGTVAPIHSLIKDLEPKIEAAATTRDCLELALEIGKRLTEEGDSGKSGGKSKGGKSKSSSKSKGAAGKSDKPEKSKSESKSESKPSEGSGGDESDEEEKPTESSSGGKSEKSKKSEKKEDDKGEAGGSGEDDEKGEEGEGEKEPEKKSEDESEKKPESEAGPEDDKEEESEPETESESEDDEEEGDVKTSDEDDEEDDDFRESSGGSSDMDDDGESEIESAAFWEELDKDGTNGYDDSMSKALSDEALRSAKNADYMPFTKDYDLIEKLPIGSSYDPMMTKRLVDKVDHMVAPLQKDLERAIAARSLATRSHGHRSGRLHAANLSRLAFNDDRVFSRKHESTSKDVAVELVVDASGSMSGSKIHTAAQAAYALSSVLDRLNIKNEVICFTTKDIGGAEKELRKQTSETGIRFSRMEGLYMPILKEYNERTQATNVKERFGWLPNTNILRSNVDGECVEIAARRLMARKEAGKIMIVLSDGYPAAAGSRGDLEQHLVRVVKDVSASGVKVVGIGIESNAVQKFYPKNLVLNNVEELPTAVIKELRHLLMN